MACLHPYKFAPGGASNDLVTFIIHACGDEWIAEMWPLNDRGDFCDDAKMSM